MPGFNESSALLLQRCIESGITSPNELANIMGNASVETRRFSTMHENLGYTSVGAIVGAVSSAEDRYTRAELQAAVDSKDPKQIATVLYEGRADLANTHEGDGYRFHGRGYFQYTGRDNYEKFGQKFGIDLKNDPDKAADPETAATLAIAYWKDKVPEAAREDPQRAGRIINGGGNGASERVTASNAWRQTITPELVEGIRSGAIDRATLATMGPPERAAGREATGKLVDPGDTMRMRDHGPGVVELQERLGRLGFQGIKPDGHFGPRTDSAVREFQTSHGLNHDGIVGPATSRAMNAQLATDVGAVQVGPASHLNDPSHQDYALYSSTRTMVCELDKQNGRVSDDRTDNLSASLLVASRAAGMASIDRIALSEDASKLWAVEGMRGFREMAGRSAYVNTTQGLNTPLEQSSAQWPTAMQSFDQQQGREQAQQQLQAQQQAGVEQAPGISR